MSDCQSPDEYAPRRVLVAGDVHGAMGWFKLLCRAAVEKDCQTILQVGDFGYWEHFPSGQVFLDYASQQLSERGLTCVWIDGNHENHTMLRKLYVTHNDRLAEVRPSLFYAPRGCRWEWNGVTFLAIGGAYSIDKAYREQGFSWWPEETITEAEVIRCTQDGNVDVLVSHDAPWGAEGVMGWATAGNKDEWPESAANRKALRAVFDAVHPKLVLHGHYHHRNSTTVEGVQVEGFARDEMGKDAYDVLDLADFKAKHGAHTGSSPDA